MDGGAEIRLTVIETRLLRWLHAHPGAVDPASALLKEVWGYQDPAGRDVVRVTMHRLLRKLSQPPPDGAGVGARLPRRPWAPSGSAAAIPE